MMTTDRTRLAPYCACPVPSRRPDSICPNLPLESRPCGGQRILWNVFILVNRLGMLSKVIEPRESARAVTLERTFTCVFSSKVSPSPA